MISYLYQFHRGPSTWRTDTGATMPTLARSQRSCPKTMKEFKAQIRRVHTADYYYFLFFSVNVHSLEWIKDLVQCAHSVRRHSSLAAYIELYGCIYREGDGIRAWRNAMRRIISIEWFYRRRMHWMQPFIAYTTNGRSFVRSFIHWWLISRPVF